MPNESPLPDTETAGLAELEVLVELVNRSQQTSYHPPFICVACHSSFESWPMPRYALVACVKDGQVVLSCPTPGCASPTRRLSDEALGRLKAAGSLTSFASFPRGVCV